MHYIVILAMRGQEDRSHGLIPPNQKLVREKRPFDNLAAEEEEEFTDLNSETGLFRHYVTFPCIRLIQFYSEFFTLSNSSKRGHLWAILTP